ncbi:MULTISPECIES: ABC transporter substrate-binding protein [Cohnella]|uniref:ABC transporter substrate-binding protein n=1 Tax=Cohnella TaxID=329857 RepID=UPI00159470D5|nr:MULTISPECIES: extracellular solute-binding protein [Cohnella]MBN2981125.1 extracellular solute-binding protein [Cohnella algarum]
MKLKRFSKWAGLLCLALTVAVTAACSSDSGSSGAEEAKEEKATLRFSWWGSEVRHQALLEAIDLYMEKNPNVTIEPEYGGFDGYYQKLVTQFAGGTAPDLTPLSVDWIEEIAVKGNLVLDLNTLKDHLNLDAFDAEFLNDYATFDGKLIGLPMGANGIVTLYNREFFEKFGISENTKWDWNTIHEIGKKVHEQDPDAYLLGLFDYRIFLQPFVNQLTGNQWINDDKSLGFDAAAAEKAFAYYRQLLDDGVIQPVEESSLYPDLAENLQWQNGNIGMMFTLASTIAKVKSYTPDVGVSMFPVPADAKTSAVLVNPSNPLAINKDTKYPEEAAKFASWLLTDPEAARILKDVYSVPAATANAAMLAEEGLIDPTVAEAVEIALSNPGAPVNGLSNNNELNQISQDILERVAFRKLEPAQAAEELTSRLADKLQTIK